MFIFKYIRIKFLFKNYKGCALCGVKDINQRQWNQQSQLQMFVFHLQQSLYLCSFFYLVYIVLTVEIGLKAMHKSNILKS